MVGNDPEIYETLKFHQNAGGAVPGHVRLLASAARYQDAAGADGATQPQRLAVAEFLREHPAVRQVFYPGLLDHPGHDIAARQMRDFSGMVSFTVRGDFQTAARLRGARGSSSSPSASAGWSR